MDKYSVNDFVRKSGYLASYSGKKKMWFVRLFSDSAVKRPLEDVKTFFVANNIPYSI